MILVYMEFTMICRADELLIVTVLRIHCYLSAIESESDVWFNLGG